jgi:hypothetical protein
MYPWLSVVCVRDPPAGKTIHFPLLTATTHKKKQISTRKNLAHTVLYENIRLVIVY